MNHNLTKTASHPSSKMGRIVIDEVLKWEVEGDYYSLLHNVFSYITFVPIYVRPLPTAHAREYVGYSPCFRESFAGEVIPTYIIHANITDGELGVHVTEVTSSEDHFYLIDPQALNLNLLLTEDTEK